MKKMMTIGAMTIAFLTVTSCSETETDLIIDSGNDNQVALGITPNLKVDAGTKAATKSVISGEAITYNVAKYSEAPGLGILITNNTATDWYTPSDNEYGDHHIWFMGDEKGEGWISIKERNRTFATTPEVPYSLTKKVGQVYAYYPYDANFEPVSASDLKLPVTILDNGTIDATVNNAKKYRDNNKWMTTKTPINLSLATEKDYLYFAAEGGRFVNNGRAGDTPVKPDAEIDNSNATNPGYKINLDMKHAMAMVTFRVYDGGKLSENNVNFTKFQIENTKTSVDKPFKKGTAYMSLVDGKITDDNQTEGNISRTITNYVLMRQVESNESDYAFIQTGTATTSVNGKNVSKAVSAIVYPVTFGDEDIQVTITLKEGDNEEMLFPVILPSNTWEAGNNYIYTLSAGRNKLSITDVTVTNWEDQEQDEIHL